MAQGMIVAEGKTKSDSGWQHCTGSHPLDLLLLERSLKTGKEGGWEGLPKKAHFTTVIEEVIPSAQIVTSRRESTFSSVCLQAAQLTLLQSL